MRRLIVFMSISLDGYFTDARGDISWAHREDPEYSAFVKDNASRGGELLMGRVTYQMMAGYWQGPFAAEQEPVIALAMSELPKVVFSTTLGEATWNNTRLVNGNLADEVRRMKGGTGPDMVTLGSGTLVGQLAAQGLVDEFQLVVVPLALGQGRSILSGLSSPLALTLTATRVFQNGNLLLTYAPG